MTNPKKIVVFDLDETLGNFVELGMFCDALEKINNIEMNDQIFFELMNLFPEFLRPNIIPILKYLINKKKHNKCEKIMIYTNNQGPKIWTKRIANYFNYKLETKVFDEIIAAFKVKGKIVEICRTSHDKKVDDLIRCTRIPRNTQICFLDDQIHPLMEDDNVFYINVKPYTYSFPFEEMAERYYNKYPEKINIDKKIFIDKITKYMKLYNYIVTEKSKVETDVDMVIGKKIISHLEIFFKDNIKKKTTKKKRIRIPKKQTRKLLISK